MRKHLLPHVAVVWVATDVFGVALTWDEARNALAEMNWESASLSMAMLNAVSAELALGGNLNTPDGAQKVGALTLYLFAPKMRKTASEIYFENRHQSFVPLSGQACIAMTEACLRFCSREGGVRFEQPHQHAKFAHILLSFQEQLLKCELTQGLNPDTLTSEQFRYFVRNYLSANFETGFPDLLRRHYMFFTGADPEGVLKKRTGKNASEWFAEITGLDPCRYGALILFSLHHGHQFNIKAPDLRHLVYDIDEMLQNAAPDAASMYRRLHDLAVVPSQIPDVDVPDWETAIYGLHYLRAKPLLHLQGTQFVCFYKHLITEKMLGGTIHVLTELVESHSPAGWHLEAKNRRLKVRREFGYLFEDYLRQLLLLLFSGPKTTHHFGLSRADGGECDALVVIGSVAMAFEFVHHPWSLAERTSGDASVFIKHLEDNITKAGKLCAQITEQGKFPELNVRIDLALPIVVTSELVPINVMTAPSLEKHLIKATSQAFVRGHHIVKPVQILSVVQLENLDRIEGLDTPEQIAAFLTRRSGDLLTRFSGHNRMEQRAVMSRKLKTVEDASDVAFRTVGPSLFKSEA